VDALSCEEINNETRNTQVLVLWRDL